MAMADEYDIKRNTAQKFIHDYVLKTPGLKFEVEKNSRASLIIVREKLSLAD